MADEKELKDQRVVTMMTPSELDAIDDWMFKNRIRSRGEAIRRLCRIGVEADAFAEKLLLAIPDLNRATQAVVEMIEPDSWEKAKTVGRLLEEVGAVAALNVELHDRIDPYRVAGEFKDAQAAMAEQQRFMEQARRRQADFIDMMEEMEKREKS